MDPDDREAVVESPGPEWFELPNGAGYCVILKDEEGT